MENLESKKTSLKNEGFLGQVFKPVSRSASIGVVILPGSEGGIPDQLAKYVAPQGYSAMALAYSGIEDLPKYHENIPLEYFQRAIQWFKKFADLKSICLIGYSRGGELALLLGATFPELLDGIVAYVPSSHVCGSFPFPNRPAWSLNGKPAAPFLRGVTSSEESLTECEDLNKATIEKIIPFHANTKKDPFDIVDLFLVRNQQEDFEKAVIAVEKLSCPLLIIAGEEDKIWPSSLYSKLIIERINEKKSKIQKTLLVFPDAGHGIIAPYEGPIYHPVGQFWCRLGGTFEGNKKANEQAWQATFSFLQKIAP